MLELFSKYKTQYNRGQIFPYLVAIICVVLILVMITVNLGQISIFKTEVSNAADSAALAGASTLSAALLALGLISDQMAGRATAAAIAIAIEVACGQVWCWVIAIITYIAFIVSVMAEYQMALGESRMAWTNAKRSALQYAFENVGVDEPRPTFEEFLEGVYGSSDITVLCPQPNQNERNACIQQYNKEYFEGDNPAKSDETRKLIRKYTQSGFNRFMTDKENGYWHFGSIEPGYSSPVKIVSGYGWNDPSSTTGTNCYDDNSVDNYKSYDNYAEVEVIGNTLYALDYFSWFAVDEICNCVAGIIMGSILVPWWLDWMSLPVDWIFGTFVFWLLCTGEEMNYLFPMGFDFMNHDTIGQTDQNYIYVTVKRYKKSNNLGLWNFRYGEVSSSAVSHAFPEHPSNEPLCDNNCETIRPVAMSDFFTFFSCQGSTGGWDEEDRHLFETEMTTAY